MFKTLSRKIVYQDAWMSLRQDGVLFTSGKEGTHTVVERKDGAFVVIYNSKNQVLLIKQYRYPIQDFDWGLPGGGIDTGESPEKAAIREVFEEVGINLNNVKHIATYNVISALSKEKINLFFAFIPEINPKQKGESDEQISEINVVSIEEVLEMIDKNGIKDPFTANALQIFSRRIKTFSGS